MPTTNTGHTELGQHDGSSPDAATGSDLRTEIEIDQVLVDLSQAIHEELSVEDLLELPSEEFFSVTDSYGFDLPVYDVAQEQTKVLSVDACPVCSGQQAQPAYAVGESKFKVVTCTECGLGRLHPAPAVSEIASFYPPHYYGSEGEKFEPMVEMMVRFVGARQAKALSRGLPNGAKILDVGCGRGVLLGSLADRGHEVHGFEISETAVAGVDERANIRIADDLSQAKYESGYFDQVIIWHVLEHLPNPRQTLMEIRRILKPGGRIVVAVPNFSSFQARWAGPAWFHLDLPRHLYHFTAESLRQILLNCGFNCQDEHHFSLRQNPFGWVQSWLNRSSNLPRNGLYTLLKNGSTTSIMGLSAKQKTWMRVAYWIGMPVATIASVFSAVLLSGASVSITAVNTESL